MAVMSWIRAIGGIFHWLTGWLIHPERGGCCQSESISEKFEDLKNKKK